MDKLVYHDALEALTNAKAKIFDITKIDADSVPAAYFKSAKISITDNTSSSTNHSYAFYACLDDGVTFNEDRIIDHCVIPVGGGTAWLNINRKISPVWCPCGNLHVFARPTLGGSWNRWPIGLFVSGARKACTI